MYKLFEIIYTSKKWYIYFFIVGFASSAIFAPLFIPILGIPLFCMLLYIIDKEKNYKTILYKSWVLFLGHFVGGCYWVCISLFLDITSYFWLLPLALFGLPSYLAIYPAIAVMSAKFFIKNNFFCFAINFASLFVLLEILREHIMTGFPWNMIGYSLAFSDYLSQIASIYGVYGMSFLTILIFLCVAKSILSKNWLHILFPVVVIIIMYRYGYVRLQDTTEFTDKYIGIVQANIPQTIKWDPNTKVNNLLKHLKMSKTIPAIETKKTMVIWPESAISDVLYEDDVVGGIMTGIIPENGLLLSGTIRGHIASEDEIEIWNSIMAIGKDGKIKGFYDKNHLVPFGEYIPLRKYIPDTIQKVTYGRIDFSEGDYNKNYIDVYGIKILPLICYEAIFSLHNYRKDIDYDFILNISNDGWFGNSNGPYQHLYMAKIRAIELGLPMVRAANTGISALFDGYGRMIDKIDLGEEGVITGFIPKKIFTSNFYTEFVNKKIIIISFITLIIICNINNIYTSVSRNLASKSNK